MRKYAEIFIYLVTVNFPYIVCSVSISAVATFWTTFYSNKNVAGSKPTKWVPFNLSRPIWSVQMCLIINFDKVVLAPDWFSGQVGLYQPLGLVTSCYSQKTVCKLLADVRVREHWWPQLNLNGLECRLQKRNFDLLPKMGQKQRTSWSDAALRLSTIEMICCELWLGSIYGRHATGL